MSVTVNKSQHSVNFIDASSTVSITNNNTGNTVNITGTDVSTITVAAPGPKGDKGDTPSTINASSIIQPFTNVTASNNISANNIISNTLLYAQNNTLFGTDDSDTHHFTGHITASGDISASGHISGIDFRASGNQILSFQDVTNPVITRADLSGVETYVFGDNTTPNATMLTGTNIDLYGPVTASGDVSASGNIHSDNIETISLSFQASSDGTNLYGPNKQGPYYSVYNYNYGDSTAVKTLAQEYAGAGIRIPYNAEIHGFNSIVSTITDPGATHVLLYTGSLNLGTFNVGTGAAADLSIGLAMSVTTGTPGAAENPMIGDVIAPKPINAGDIIYPRIKVQSGHGAYVNMQILLKRRK